MDAERSFFLARCDACRWQKRCSDEAAAQDVLAAHLEEFHAGQEVGTEEGQVPAQVSEVETEFAQRG